MSEMEAFSSREREPTPAERLVGYLRGQFADAWRKEVNEDGRGDESPHGAFVQRVPLEVPQRSFKEPAGRYLTQDTHRIVMKRPHPYDRTGDYYEVFALVAGRGDDSGFDESEAAARGEVFLVRRHRRLGPAGPFWLIDLLGARLIDYTVAGRATKAVALDKMQADAAKLAADLAGYNIVAVKE